MSRTVQTHGAVINFAAWQVTTFRFGSIIYRSLVSQWPTTPEYHRTILRVSMSTADESSI